MGAGQWSQRPDVGREIRPRYLVCSKPKPLARSPYRREDVLQSLRPERHRCRRRQDDGGVPWLNNMKTFIAKLLGRLGYSLTRNSSLAALNAAAARGRGAEGGAEVTTTMTSNLTLGLDRC